MKKNFFTEMAYVVGIIILALGTAFMERAEFGMSMIVAPAYILHLKLSEAFPFFTFGMGEYLIQTVLIVLLAIILRKVNKSYLFSFVTAVIYGFILDLTIAMVSLIPNGTMAVRLICYTVGLVLCTIGVSFLFHTYISPEAYELFVKEIATEFKIPIDKCKTVYDCTSCVISIVLSFLFFGFGHFEGVKWGTIICALLNGWLIGRMTFLLESVFEFKDALPFRKYFEK